MVMTFKPDAKLRLKRILTEFEGSRNFPYTDTTGHITIGVGRNLTSCGLTKSEIDVLLTNDIDYFISYLAERYEYFDSLDENRQIAIINMCFNLGTKAFAEFISMNTHMQKGNYEAAANYILQSKYATEVGQRAIDIANTISTGNL